MKCLVTGATGFIGSRLIEKLLDLDYEVNVIVRTPESVPESFSHKVQIFKGDVLNVESINRAINDCDTVFHLAAFAGIWSKDKALPYKINVVGTKNILDAALQHNIRKVVFTSTAGTLAPSENMEEVDEGSALPGFYHTDYERSKLQAEQLCTDYSRQGLNVVVVNPTRVFGPGPLNKSNSVTVMIKNYLKGYWRFIPGNGESTGNYTFIDDVTDGHLKALKRGISGEKYILGGTNLSFNDFFYQLSQASGKNFRMLHLPYPLVYSLSAVESFLADSIGKKPLITPPWARRYKEHRLVSSQKAVEQLGYTITPLRLAMKKTIQWLQHQK